MELPNSKRELLLYGSSFVLRLPFLYQSYRHNHPMHVSPLSVDINITDRCNYLCKQCRGAIPNYKPKEEMTFADLQKIIDEMCIMKIPYLGLCGGEPLLRYDLVVQTVQYANKVGIKTGIVTNGSLLDENKLCELAKIGLYRMALSLDGSTREIHDYNRMPGSFDHITQILSLYRELKLDKEMSLYLFTVVMKNNYMQLLEIANIAKSFNATVFYQPVGLPQVYDQRDSENTQSTGVEQLTIHGSDLALLEKEIHKLVAFKKKYGVVGNLLWQLSNIVNYYKRLENSSLPTPFKCYTGYNSIRIDSDGAVSSCMFMPEVGNIKKAGLKEIWLSNDYNSHRKAIKQCNRPCALNCYYPVSLPGLINEFAILPAKRKLGL